MKLLPLRTMAEKIKQLFDIDIFSNESDELDFEQIIKLWLYKIDKNSYYPSVRFLEEATINGQIPARREGYHIFDFIGGRQVERLRELIDPIEALELDQGSPKREHLNPMIQTNSFDSYGAKLFTSAKILKGCSYIERPNKVLEYYDQSGRKLMHGELFQVNIIHINWFYSPLSIKEWLESNGGDPGEFLEAWFFAKERNEGKKSKTVVEEQEIKLTIAQFFCMFPHMPDNVACAIKETVRLFISEHKSYPTHRNQIWHKLITAPPADYLVEKIMKDTKGCWIQATDNSKVEALLIDSVRLTKEAFRKRWNDYTSSRRFQEDSGE